MNLIIGPTVHSRKAENQKKIVCKGLRQVVRSGVLIQSKDISRFRARYTFDKLASDISSGELNTSPKLGTYIPALFTWCSTRVLVSRLDVAVTSPIFLRKDRLLSGCLFSSPASRLDAFSVYPLRLSYPTLLCRTMGTP